MTDKKEKQYSFSTTIEWTTLITATSKKEAIERLKESFEDEYNIEITEDEFKLEEVTKA